MFRNDLDKVCPKCGIRKSLQYFGKDKYSSDGLTSWCKECRKKKGDEWDRKIKAKNLEKIPCVEYKICSKCGKKKPSSQFYRNIYSKDGLSSQCIECITHYTKSYYDSNKEEVLHRGREWRKNNKEWVKNYDKKYRVDNKDRVRANKKRWNAENKDRVTERKRDYNKRYWKEHKEELLLAGKRRYEINREKYLEEKRKYYQDNKDEIRVHKLNRRHSDIEYKMVCNIRNRLTAAVKNNQKSGSAIRDLGCSIEFLKDYIQSKFYPNPETGEMMTWDNWSRKGWHMDHIIPLVAFDLTDREQFLKACHYTNLQPLWAKENLRKGSKAA